MSLGSSGVAWFIGVCPWVRQVHPWSFVSLGWVLGVVRFIRVHCGILCWSSGSFEVAGFIAVRPVGGRVHQGSCVHLGVRLVSSESSGVAGFIGVHPVDRRVHPGLLGSLGCALGIVWFIRGRWVHWGAPWGSLDSSGSRVDWDVPWGASVSSGFIGVRPGIVWFIRCR